MGYVPGCSTDLFISYAHKDNVDGWVSALDSYLRLRVPQFLEHEAQLEIWRDQKLGGFDLIWDSLKSRVSSSALFLSILSPVYVTSKSCEVEVEHFLSSHVPIPRVDARSRSARAVIIPYANAADVKPLFRRSDTVTYRFFRSNPDDTILQFNPDVAEFTTEAERLAQHIAKQLRRLRLACLTRESAATPLAKTVFIANCSKDRANDRDTLLNEMSHHRLLTIPDGVYMRQELSQQTQQRLAEADCSIHVLGETAGVSLDDAPEAVAHLQYQLALAHRPVGFRQIVWIRRDIVATPGPHGELLQAIRALDAKVWNEGCEVMSGSFDDLLRGVKGVLSRETAAPDISGPMYILCAKADLDDDDANLRKLSDHLCESGILPEFPAFDDQDVDLAKIEETLISQSRATLIYYGRGGDGWVKLKRQTVLRVVGEAGTADRYVRALYVSEPSNVPKRTQYLRLKISKFVEAKGYPPLLILGTAAGFEPDYLKPLLERL